MRDLDCKGLACPQPVLKTKELIEAHSPADVRVLVDNEAASENVARFLRSQGFEALVESVDGGFAVLGKRENGKATCRVCEPMSFEQPEGRTAKTLVMIATDRMGFGDERLGKKLMLNFLATLPEMEGLWRLVLVNNGVKLTVDGAETVPVLRDLEAAGVDILVCGTCLTHFGILERKQVGETTNMLDVVTSMQVADKVINL